MRKQKTIKKEILIEGVGLHTGKNVHLKFKPAPINTGICFVRTDLAHKPIIKADIQNVFKEKGVARCTPIGAGEATIYTIEHLMSILSGLEISNLMIEIDGAEIPGLDGSGIEFLKKFKEAGIEEQPDHVKYFDIKEPICVFSQGASIYAVPYEGLKISYVLDYDHPVLRSQFFSLEVNQKNFEEQVASCRTFCLESEAEQLKSLGFGKGANYQNTLVVGQDEIIENELRFEDEFARHKVLDLIGDLYLLGFPVRGHFYAIKSGHALNVEMVEKILNQKKRYEEKGLVFDLKIDNGQELDIAAIMKILPHRYPFLLVDRVLDLEKGKRAVGVKNVTINDGFFAGHFPTRPVMPGVLMVEAMAQLAGIAVLTHDQNRGKLALFMSVDNVKFRKVVEPGDQLLMEAVVTKERSRIVIAHGESKVNGVVVAEADITLSFADGAYLD